MSSVEKIRRQSGLRRLIVSDTLSGISFYAVYAAALVFGVVATRTGVRPVISSCFIGIGIASAIAGIIGTLSPTLTIAFLLLAAIAASGLDGVGAIPFMRAVKPRERAKMTSVYRSFIEVSEILPGFVFAFLLSVFDTSTVFIVVGVGSVLMAGLTFKHLPKSL